MGQFGPSNRLSRYPVAPDVALYCSGVFVCATASVALLDAAIGGFSKRFDPHTRYVGVLSVAVVLIIFDLLRTCFAHVRSSCGLRRQTPYSWRAKGPVGILGWGLDTGIPFTTIRATSMPLIATTLICLGFGKAWFGVAYAGGLTAGVVTGLRLTRPSPTDLNGVRRVHEVLVRRGSRLTKGLGLLLPTAAVIVISLLRIATQA